MAAEHPELVDKYWRILVDEAGGTLPQFSRKTGQARARRMSLTRRSLLRRGGATAAGAGVLGSLAAAAPAAAQLGDDRARNALLVVLPLVRADHVDAFEGGAPAKTPNLNELTKKSLRFDRAHPGVDARAVRAPLARDRHARLPVPRLAAARWLPVGARASTRSGTTSRCSWRSTRAAGIETIYVTDNPLFQGARFAGRARERRRPAAAASPARSCPPASTRSC